MTASATAQPRCLPPLTLPLARSRADAFVTTEAGSSIGSRTALMATCSGISMSTSSGATVPTHQTKEIRFGLAKRPRRYVCFTLISASWVTRCKGSSPIRPKSGPIRGFLVQSSSWSGRSLRASMPSTRIPSRCDAQVGRRDPRLHQAFPSEDSRTRIGSVNMQAIHVNFGLGTLGESDAF